MTPRSTLAYVGLGSNLDQPIRQVQRALGWLRRQPGVDRVRASPLQLTAAVGPPQPDYVNAVAELRTTLSPVGLLHALQRLERAARRRREVHWGARTLDLDLLFFGDQILRHPDLHLPHPRAHERRFVLEPLSRLAPDLRHPLLDQTVAELLKALNP